MANSKLTTTTAHTVTVTMTETEARYLLDYIDCYTDRSYRDGPVTEVLRMALASIDGATK